MSFKSAVISEIKDDAGVTALISSRVHPARTLDTTTPYVSVEITQSEPLTHMAGADGLIDTRFDVDIYGDTALIVQQVADAVDSAINAFTGDLGSENLRTRFIKQTDAIDDFIAPADASQTGLHHRRVVYQAYHF